MICLTFNDKGGYRMVKEIYAKGTDVVPEKISMYDVSSDPKKKSLFEKLGLIEPIEQAGSHSDQEYFENVENDTESKEEMTYSEMTSTPNPVTPPEKKDTIDKLSIDEIYTVYNLLPKTATNTVYLIDNFLKALPANLPFEVKRESLVSLFSASQINMLDLVNDGKERLDILSQYFENFTKDLEEIISYNKMQIKALNEKITYHNSIIEERNRTLEEQKAIVKFEAQKISSIIDFVRNEDI